MIGKAQAGYAMVALLVGLSIMGVVMTMAMPVWRQLAVREREAELVFRGEQYKRSIALYQARTGPGALPPSIDVLVEGRFLRKRYKDPITGGDFVLIRQGQAQGRGAQPAPVATGGILGVTSASRERSIRLYDGRNYYNEWQFIHLGQAQAPGAGITPPPAGEGPTPNPGTGGRGGPPSGRGGPGPQPGSGRGRGRGNPP
jgi:type II secretory pathway pseudopilin PulG